MMIFLETLPKTLTGINSNVRTSLKIESNLLSELAENQKRICVGEGYFIRVLEVLRQTGNRFGF
jgi:hypothetical protein